MYMYMSWGDCLHCMVQVYHADVCDGGFVHYLMRKYNFTDVVHMAAQAGVRYSLEDPQAYVTANYQCFISLLDVLLDFPVSCYCSVAQPSLSAAASASCRAHTLCMHHLPACTASEHLFRFPLKSLSEPQATSMQPPR